MSTSEGWKKAAWGVGGSLTAALVVWTFTWLTETRAMAVAAKAATDSVDITTSATHITLRKDFEHADAMIASQLSTTNSNLEKTNETIKTLSEEQKQTRDSVNRVIVILERMERNL